MDRTLRDPLLMLYAESLDDMERTRIACENRLRQLTLPHGQTGFGLTADVPEVARMTVIVDGLKRLEHEAELTLCRQLRTHPLYPWVKAARGVGEKQAARLLAAIGDPYISDLAGGPRTVSQLWAYCGYHTIIPASHAPRDIHEHAAGGDQAGSDPGQALTGTQPAGSRVAANRRKGQRANWNAEAKMRAYLVAESCMKAGGPLRDIYDTTRKHYDGAVHAMPCVRCGPSGKPAPVGSELSAGHQHARALRAIAKEVLQQLWQEARAWHLGQCQAT